jgi:hypothetical protein
MIILDNLLSSLRSDAPVRSIPVGVHFRGFLHVTVYSILGG